MTQRATLYQSTNDGTRRAAQRGTALPMLPFEYLVVMDAHIEDALTRLQEFLRAHDIISPLASVADLDTAKQALWRLENVPFDSDECQLFAYAFGELISKRYVARWLHNDGEPSRFQVKAGSQALSLDVWGLTQQAFQTSGQSFSEALDEIIDMLDANGADTKIL